ncbi:hypothetical protein EWB00_005044 [Schistosoma japonicum]|uniref:Uncharacterized protein n=2 Tax=Schistosoma japonicum TaxID=6182 RepID=A0A4Z2D384_SCHJA|nr:hypothetical protein EWB00_005044 [Schistosoma japonicum]
MENQRSLESLTIAELEKVLSRQINLRDSFLSKLPDSGERLVSSIEKIQFILSERKSRIFTKGAEKTSITNNLTKDIHKLSKFSSKYEENKSEYCIDKDPSEYSIDSLSNDFSNISISLSHSGAVSGSNEKCDYVPCIPHDEYTAIRQSLNLPCSYISSSFRWFTFSFRFVGDFVYLSVVDCSNPNRRLLRTGLSKIWFPRMNFDNTKSVLNEIPSLEKVSLCQPTHALHDLWIFLSTNNNQNRIMISSTQIYCLICYSSINSNNNSNNLDDIVYLSRLINTTRHSNIVRSTQPYNCYFSNACYALSAKTSHINDDSTDEITKFLNDMKKQSNDSSICATSYKLVGQQFIEECCKLCKLLFKKSAQNDDNNIKSDISLRHFSNPLEYLQLSKAKTLMWMEAPTELYFLRKIKTACNIMANKSTLASTNNQIDDLNRIPDNIFRRLAAVGLGRTRLTRLAGLGGWELFAGFLAYRPLTLSSSILQSSELTSYSANEENISKHGLVTNDLETIRILYTYFRNVYMHLDRHEKCYLETNNNNHNVLIKSVQSDISGKLHNPFLPSYLNYYYDNDKAKVSDTNKHILNDKIQAWISSGNQLFDPLGHRQLCTLSMDQSMNLMKNVQVNYEKSRIKYKLPLYPSMPPERTELSCYRDPSVLLLKEMDSSSSSVSTSSSSSDDSDTDNNSLRLEDVD